MGNKEYCVNCRVEINQLNWKIGKFRCKNCYGKEDELDVDEVVVKVIKIVNCK